MAADENKKQPADAPKKGVTVPQPDTEEGAAYADYLANRVKDFVEKDLNAVMYALPGQIVSDPTNGVLRQYPASIHVQPKAWYEKKDEDKKADEKPDAEPKKPEPGTESK